MNGIEMLARLRLAGFAMFAREGLTIDGVTVGDTTAGKPDVDPTTNWPQLGDCLNLTLGVEEEPESDYVPSAGGVYRKQTDTLVVLDYIDFGLRQMHSVLWELLFGVSDPVAQDVEQVPYTQQVREVTGWLKLQLQAQGYDDVVVMDAWGKPTMYFRGIPVKMCEAILDTETAIS